MAKNKTNSFKGKNSTKNGATESKTVSSINPQPNGKSSNTTTK